MRFKGLDLNLLLALDALLTDQNVTRAAERVALSQSAMSGALSRLREHFEDDLLVQVQRRMLLTPLARSLQQPLQSTLTSISRLLDARANFEPATSDRRFTVSCSDYVWALLMTSVLSDAAMQAPDVAICYAGPSSRFEEADADLLIAPQRYVAKDRQYEELFHEDYVCIAWTGNRSIGNSLSRQRYFALGHVVAMAPGPTFVEAWLRQRYGEIPRAATIAPNFMLVPHSVVGTKHVATVPLRLAHMSAQYLPLKIIAAPVEIPPMIDLLQWRSHQNDDPGLRWLRSLIKRTAGRTFEQSLSQNPRFLPK